MAGFAEIIGHEQIIEHLQNAILSQKVSHAYILNGPDDSGKKMIAEAFAMALQCEKPVSYTHLDVYKRQVHPYYTETKVLEMGVETFDMNGQKIKIYEKERLICDCLKYEDRLDADSLKKGLLAFIKDEEKDIAKLMMYARERRVVEKVRNRIGVWL